MSLSIGITGLPNVGKSTLFNALTEAGAEASNYPFCTIDRNVGMVPVPDERLRSLENVVDADEVIPATVKIVDIAGLVEGASTGEGLGNRFLAHIRETDALIHVVRQFTDRDVSRFYTDTTPAADFGIVETELLLADLEVAEKALEKLQSRVRLNRKEDVETAAILSRVKETIEKGTPLREAGLGEEELRRLAGFAFLTAKPVIAVLNVEEEFNGDPGGTGLPENVNVVPFSAKLEREIIELPEDERKLFIEELGMSGEGRRLLLEECLRLLGLITFYTVENRILQAWNVKNGTAAPVAAGKIHSDMEKGFIRAEVVSAEELIPAGSMKELANLGKVRSEGRDYIVKDGDVIKFLFNP